MAATAAVTSAPTTRGTTHAAGRGAPEFFSALPLASVALFALNNGVLKHASPGLITGKLSDLTVCFFLPLFVSAVLERVSRLALSPRVLAGIGLTATIFVAVKTSEIASRLLDRDITLLLAPFGIHTAPNRVDVTDLCALPMLALAWIYARRRGAR